jgi:protein gp37
MYRGKTWHKQNPKIVNRSKTTFNDPIKWKDGRMVFTCSYSDWFIKDADPWRAAAWDVILKSPQHTFQILTKRPERIMANLPSYFNQIADRVWIGVSVESQNEVDRLKYLLPLTCKTFASFEPLIGPIAWDNNMSQLDWTIVGGESGNNFGTYRFRPMEIGWAENLVVESARHNVPCFVKQMGTYLSNKLQLTHKHGETLEEFPSTLMVQQFPPNKHGK